MNLQKNKIITFDNIIEAVCRFFNVKQRDIFGQSRRKDIARARQTVAYIAREELNESFPNIGKKLGKRDHTTAIHSYKTIQRILDKDNNAKKEIGKILDLIQGLANTHPEEEEIKEVKFIKKERTEKTSPTVKKSPLDFPATKLPPKALKRQTDILEKYKSGLTLKEIGLEFNLSRERIRQIVMRAITDNAREIVASGVDLDLKEFIEEEKNVHAEYVSKRHISTLEDVDPVVKKEKRWSKYYDKCRDCGTIFIKHQCHGYCTECYHKTELFKELQRSSRLRNIDARKKYVSEYCKKYYKRPEVVVKLKKKADLKLFGGNREAALKRDNYKCCVCGISQAESFEKLGRDLCVVHINGTSNHDLDNLITRCTDCHNGKMIKIMRLKLKETRL